MTNKIKFFAAVISVVTSVSAFAQDWKPMSGEMGMTFGATGLSSIGVTNSNNPTGTLMFRDYISDDMAVRIGLNFSNSSSTSYSLGLGSKTTSTTKSTGLGLSVGMQHNFTGTDRLEPYMAIDLGIGTAGGSTDVLTEAADSVGNPT